MARSGDPPSEQFGMGGRSEASSALKQIDDQNDNGNHEEEMN